MFSLVDDFLRHAQSSAMKTRRIGTSRLWLVRRLDKINNIICKSFASWNCDLLLNKRRNWHRHHFAKLISDGSNFLLLCFPVRVAEKCHHLLQVVFRNNTAISIEQKTLVELAGSCFPDRFQFVTQEHGHLTQSFAGHTSHLHQLTEQVHAVDELLIVFDLGNLQFRQSQQLFCEFVALVLQKVSDDSRAEEAVQERKQWNNDTRVVQVCCEDV